MDEKAFEIISNHAFRKVISKYEQDIDIDTSNIISNNDFFKYVDKRIEGVRAHCERYTHELAMGLINFYENKK
jgi:hypothetical protein